MSPLDATWQLLGLFMPALSSAAIAAAAAKWLWRSQLSGVSWRRLAAWPMATGSLALLTGLLVFGRDGRMWSYALMVAVSAIALGWAGFGAARR